MDTKTVVIAFGLIAMLWLGGCFPTASASTDATAQPINNQPCYDKANDIVAPAWGDMNQIQRAVLAMQVINTCEAK